MIAELFFARQAPMVCCILNPQYCFCAAVSRTDKKTYQLHHHELMVCTQLELEQQIIFNPSKIGSFIDTFVKKQGCRHTQLSISISGPALTEEFGVNASIEPPKNAACASATISKESADETTWYRACLAREVLFQYKLLAIRYRWPLGLVTTRTAALWHFEHKDAHIEPLPRCSHQNDLCASLVPETVGLFIAGRAYED